MFCHHKSRMLSTTNMPWIQFLPHWPAELSFLANQRKLGWDGCPETILPTECHFRWSVTATVNRIFQEVNRWKHRPLINRERWNMSSWELSSCGESQKAGKHGDKEHSKEYFRIRFVPILTILATLFGLKACLATEGNWNLSHSPLCGEGSC